jgi:uncharacterized NAD-dependent epimerase/dehydratase family protein
MTTQLQLLDAVAWPRHQARSSQATGQTGILIEGSGVGIDAVIADFHRRAADKLVLDCAKEADLVLVEGQGSIIHPSYSGVTYGLIHGSLPHAQVMCAQPVAEGDQPVRVGEDSAARGLHQDERGGDAGACVQRR